MSEVGAANSAREILSGMQVTASSYIFSSSEKGSSYSANDFGQDFAKDVAWTFLFPILGMAAQKAPQFLGGAKAAKKLEKVWGIPDSQVLRTNMKAAGVQSPKYPNAAHHIVPGAQNQPDANAARTHLAKLGIGSNDAANGVFLEYRKTGISQRGTGSIHNDIHTDVYYAEVRRRILRTKNKQQAELELQTIAWELQNDTFPY